MKHMLWNIRARWVLGPIDRERKFQWKPFFGHTLAIPLQLGVLPSDREWWKLGRWIEGSAHALRKILCIRYQRNTLLLLSLRECPGEGPCLSFSNSRLLSRFIANEQARCGRPSSTPAASIIAASLLQQAVMTVRHTRHNVQTHPICHNKASWRLFRINGDNSLSSTTTLLHFWVFWYQRAIQHFNCIRFVVTAISHGPPRTLRTRRRPLQHRNWAHA